MKTTTIINGKEVNLYVGYAMNGADEYFSNLEDLKKYWTPYYSSRVELEEKAVISAVVETEGGLPIWGEIIKGALTSKEKEEIAKKAAAAAYGMVTIETF